ncbi:MAG TPA: hypothetical protein VGW40_12095 [Allosphingosinicella sp.]|nr:hypothetical protein [Allosphingosinicella sp.]
MTSPLDRLASALGRRDEEPNVAPARDLAAGGNVADVAALAAALGTAPRPIRHDAIKALYEVGALRPDLVRPHAGAFLAAMNGIDNRLAWGALAALDTLAAHDPGLIAAHLPEILAAAARGSVIAKDKAVSILATLAALPGIAPEAWAALLAMVEGAAVNQAAMYAEAALRAAPMNDPAALAALLRKRRDGIVQPAKRARLEKVLRQLARL